MELQRTQLDTVAVRRTPDTYRTRRDALLRRLDDLGVDAESAEQWCRAWEALADATARDRHSPRYWVGSTRWILEHRDGGHERLRRVPVMATKRRPRPSR